MKPIRPGEPYATARLIERQMLLSSVRQKAVQESPTAEPARGFRFLTISRYVGSLGDPIASALASHLGWHVYDREIVDHIAKTVTSVRAWSRNSMSAPRVWSMIQCSVFWK